MSDLGSTNGTKVNGLRISAPRQLENGDEITVGSTTVRFEARPEGDLSARPGPGFLEYVFLALLYLFFLRVVRAVGSSCASPGWCP